MRIEVSANVMRLYNGRRSFYGSITIGSRHVFVSRWDTVRVRPKAGNVDIWRGPEMTWYCGTWRTQVSA